MERELCVRPSPRIITFPLGVIPGESCDDCFRAGSGLSFMVEYRCLSLRRPKKPVSSLKVKEDFVALLWAAAFSWHLYLRGLCVSCLLESWKLLLGIWDAFLESENCEFGFMG